jgi:hypothetical protein
MSGEKYQISSKNSITFGSTSEYVTEISFKNYKIDYNKCLGSGVFGSVFKVVPRPENEKGLLKGEYSR